ncbi:MAG: reverse transcriptase-like protein [Phycisphaeraceae bacterium]
MDLILQFDHLVRGPRHATAVGIVITDAQAARAIHEAGHDLGDQPTPQAAALAALLKSLQVVAPLRPDTLELRCCNELLVRQITSGGAACGTSGVSGGGGETSEAAIYEQVLALLLRIDSWRMTLIEPADNRRAYELAERAFAEGGPVTDLHHHDSRQLHHSAHTGIPQWTVELLEHPGHDCPAHCTAGKKYPFGPDLPGGFCVHAAIVALADGPMTWSDPDQKQMTTYCPHCETPLRITRVS